MTTRASLRLTDLPVELLSAIIVYLPAQDIFAARRVHPTLHACAVADRLWESLLEQHADTFSMVAAVGLSPVQSLPARTSILIASAHVRHSHTPCGLRRIAARELVKDCSTPTWDADRCRV